MAAATKTKTEISPPAIKPRRTRLSFDRLREPSTWAGIAMIGTAIATDGASAFVTPALFGQVMAGLGLIFTQESSN